MESSTRLGSEQRHAALQGYAEVRKEWEQVQEQMGIDLEQTARATKAIQRLRQIRSAADLLHLILFFAISDWSLRLCGAWSLLSGIGYLSDVAILKRLRRSRAWLSQLVGLVLAKRCGDLQKMPGVRLRILDATSVSHAGSKGIDWRVHLSFDLSHFCLDGVELTDCHGGETLARFPSQSNEIQIADSGYAFASGMDAVLWKGAGLVVRINWRNVAVFTPEGQRFQMMAWLRTVQAPSEQPVLLETPRGWVRLRLLAAPIPAEKAEAARRRVRQRYQRKQKTVTQETLFAAGFVLLLTNLPVDPWTISLVFFLYKVRWQIELLIKRLKGLLHFDCLRAKDPELAQTYLLAKLLIALLLDQMAHQVSLQQPIWFVSLDHPVNPTRLTVWFYEAFRQILFGPWLAGNLARFWLIMRRYFCDPPRSRPQQLAWAKAIFDHVVLSNPAL